MYNTAVYHDLLGLPYPVGPVLCLDVHLGVPVGVEQHHGVRGLQVDAEAASPRGEDEHELLRPLLVEYLHLVLPVLRLGGTYIIIIT